jgi:aspartyl-tRNA(Asn)/glutamyl-tRNA(Gln) amidotransferase subunit A
MDAYATIMDLAQGLRSGAFSATELTRFFLERIVRHDTALNAFITCTEDLALAEAAAADARLRAGTATPLTGIPIAHKDLFCTRGVRTSCASRMLDNFVAPYDATVVERMRGAGMVMLGKTNMDEFAMGSSTENSWYGRGSNPWDRARVPGGSSGGSAVAVAAGLTPAATGTDTGGSIRQPAAFCGISGLKPTYGRVSRYGMVAFASSLDQGGPMARDVRDLALLLGAMGGFDPRDSTSAERPIEDAAFDSPAATNWASRPLTIGLPREYFSALTDRALQTLLDDARQVLEKHDIRFADVSLPHTTAAVPVYYVIASAEASTNLSRYDGARFGYRCERPRDLADMYQRSRSEGFGAEVKRRILTGTYALSVGYYDAYYVKAQRIRRLIRDDFVHAFADIDLILAPTAPNVAFAHDQLLADPIAMYQQDIFTIPANLAGLPALALPCGFSDGLPVGMQLIGPHFAERALLEAGARYQSATDWHRRRPPLPGEEA